MTEQIIKNFKSQNKKTGLRVFVAGGSRPGHNDSYVKDAYNLGLKIIEKDLKLDFGFGDKGIMGAIAKGVIDTFDKKEKKAPIAAITTQEYLSLYDSNTILEQMEEIVIAKTLEERKQKLLDADFVVFAPGGVGTLDELAYDCVAMQDGLIAIKPFVFFNTNGFFYHLLEYLKHINLEGFSDPVPFIVVEDEFELGIVFDLLKLKYSTHDNKFDAYKHSRQIMYELPYFVEKIKNNNCCEEDLIAQMKNISMYGNAQDRSALADEIEDAFLKKEIARLNTRLKKSKNNAKIIQEKIDKYENLKKS